jgi:hypothetical protein
LMFEVKILVSKSGFYDLRFQDDLADRNFWGKSATRDVLVSKDIPECRAYWNCCKSVKDFCFKIACCSTNFLIRY